MLYFCRPMRESPSVYNQHKNFKHNGKSEDRKRTAQGCCSRGSSGIIIYAVERTLDSLESERKTYMQARRETEWRLEVAQDKVQKNDVIITYDEKDT